jgi:hypothetical protein
VTTQWLLGWWNLIFLVPFFLALLYLCLYSLTGISFGEPDADADLDGDWEGGGEFHGDVEIDHDLDADLDHDLDADLDHDVEMDADHDWDADSELDHDADLDHDGDLSHEAPGGRGNGSVTGSLTALAWLGVGRVPLSLLVMFLLLTWGALGFMSNYLLSTRGARADQAVLLSFAVALVGSVLLTRLLGRLMVRYLPLNETTARRRHELLGLNGEALYAINDRFGMAAVRDDRGELYQVPCRVEAGSDIIAKGTVVRLVGYSAKDKLFYVVGRGDGGAATA